MATPDPRRQHPIQRVARHRSMRAAIAGVVATAILGLALAGCDATTGGVVPPDASPTNTTAASPAATATLPVTPTTGGYSVLVYFSKHPASDNDVSAVFPVKRVSPTLGVATYAMQQLIAGPTASEAASGYYTELHGALSGNSTCGGADFQINLNTHIDPHTGVASKQNGNAVVAFCKTVSLPGDLSGGRIKTQITKTMTQFATVSSVQILNKDGHCFDDLSGQNNC